MLVPQALSACCVFDIKIIINCRKSFSQAEICDPEKSVWVSIPDPHHTHNSAYPRAMIDGNVHVWHKGLTTIQILNKVGCERRVEDSG